MKAENHDALESFIEYCESHPHERFWQALRNWSKFSFIIGSDHGPHMYVFNDAGQRDAYYEGMQDTFYLKGMEGKRESN